MRIFGQFPELSTWVTLGPAIALLPTTSYPASKAKQLHVWLLSSGEAPHPPAAAARSSAPHPSISATHLPQHLHSPAQAQPAAFPDGSHRLGLCYFPQGVSLLALFPQTAELSSTLLSVFSAHPRTAHSSPCPASLACRGFPDKRPGLPSPPVLSVCCPQAWSQQPSLACPPVSPGWLPYSRRSSSGQSWPGLQAWGRPDRDELRGPWCEPCPRWWAPGPRRRGGGSPPARADPQ